MEVIPSSQLLCPDPTVCAQSSYSSLFMGGYNLKIHVTENQPGVQLELPQVMRGFGSSPPTVEPAAVRQVAAALASFLNHHYSETCETDVNFGLPCLHGSAVYGTCVCNEGYAGTDCSDCAEGYLAVNGQCMRLVMLSPPSEATQKYASAFPTTSSGKKYPYTRKFSAQLPWVRCRVPSPQHQFAGALWQWSVSQRLGCFQLHHWSSPVWCHRTAFVQCYHRSNSSICDRLVAWHSTAFLSIAASWRKSASGGLGVGHIFCKDYAIRFCVFLFVIRLKPIASIYVRCGSWLFTFCLPWTRMDKKGPSHRRV